MLKLQRAIRIKETAELPSGKTITINVNVEEKLPDLIESFAEVSRIADELKQRRDENTLGTLYRAYSKFLSIAVGSETWTALLSEFDAEERELCEAFADWVNGTLVPAIGAASARRMQKMKK